jgi:hypothetical protein
LNPSERFLSGFGAYTPMHEVVPSAVSTAEMIDAMICSVHFKVSFFVIRCLMFRSALPLGSAKNV